MPRLLLTIIIVIVGAFILVPQAFFTVDEDAAGDRYPIRCRSSATTAVPDFMSNSRSSRR